MIQAFFNLLLITGAIYGILFNIVTLSFFPKRRVSFTILFLNLLILSISLNNIQAWLIAKGFISDWFFIRHFKVPWYFFIVPSFYIFLIHFLRIEHIHKSFTNLLLAIFGFESMFRLGLIAYCYIMGYTEGILSVYNQYEEIINVVIALFLFWKCYRIIFKEAHLYEFALRFDDLRWLKQFMILGTIVISFWVIAVFINLFLDIPQDYMYYPLRLGSSLLIYWIAFQAFLRYNLRTDRVQLRKDIQQSELSARQNKIVSSIEFPKASASLLKQIEIKELYLNPNLSLETCAESLQVSSSHLSKVINAQTNQNFSDLINDYRVRYATSLLKNPDFDHYTILSIGLESGFNSKSTFYSAFKKSTGQTPSEFKKKDFK